MDFLSLLVPALYLLSKIPQNHLVPWAARSQEYGRKRRVEKMRILG
jgi:hypothetical protein